VCEFELWCSKIVKNQKFFAIPTNFLRKMIPKNISFIKYFCDHFILRKLEF